MAFKRPAASGATSSAPAAKRPAAARKRPVAAQAREISTVARAFQAQTFEEEREIILHKAAGLAEADQDFLTQLGAFAQELDCFSDEATQDRQIALATVAVSGDFLQFFSHELKDDEGVVLASIRERGFRIDCETGLRHASARLQSKRDFVLKAVGAFGDALCDAADELRGDRTIVREAVRTGVVALSYASEELRADREIVLEAVKKSSHALRFASGSLRRDKEIVLEAVKFCGYALADAAAELRDDKEVVLQAVLEDGRALQYASESLKSDREVVLAALALPVEAPASALETGELEAERSNNSSNNNNNSSNNNNNYKTAQTERSEPVQTDNAEDEGQEDKNPRVQTDRDAALPANISEQGEDLPASNKQTTDKQEEASPACNEEALLFAKTKAYIFAMASRGLRSDKDFVLLVVRRSSDLEPGDRHLLFEEAEPDLRESLPWLSFARACDARLAVPGQQAPILSAAVSLTGPPASERSAQHSQPSQRSQDSQHFQCVATLLSGATITCAIPNVGRAEPTINDLVNELVKQIPKQTEVTAVTHIFLTMLLENGETIPVTVWDHDKPLADVLSSNEI